MDFRRIFHPHRRTGFTGVIALSLIWAAMAVLHPSIADSRNIKVGVIDCYSGPPAGIDHPRWC